MGADLSAWCSFRIPTIRASLKRLLFILSLLSWRTGYPRIEDISGEQVTYLLPLFMNAGPERGQVRTPVPCSEAITRGPVQFVRPWGAARCDAISRIYRNTAPDRINELPVLGIEFPHDNRLGCKEGTGPSTRDASDKLYLTGACGPFSAPAHQSRTASRRV